jgi:hypothetical protein
MKNYTKVNLFTLAHSFTKSIIQAGDDYRATFGLVLSYLNQDITISLKEVCDRLGIEPKKARRIMRNAELTHEGFNWTWNGTVPTKILNLLTA